MTGYDGAGSIYAIRMRLTRLNPDGSPLLGSKSQIVSNALTKANFTPQLEDGDEIQLKNGGGELCVYWKAPATLKSMDFEIDLCSPDPESAELLSGGEVLVDGSDSIGYAAPLVGAIPVPNGVSVELWSRAIVNSAPAVVNPYIHWLFPRLFLAQDQLSFDADAAQPVFKGTGQPNAGWGTGPDGDWEFTSDRLWQWVRTDTLPGVTDGYAAVTGSPS